MIENPSQQELNDLLHFYESGQISRAFNISGELVSKYPFSSQIFNIRGVILRKLNRHTEALENYLKAIDIKWDFADAYNNMGNVYNDMGEIKKSLAAFTQAVKIKPDHTDANVNLADLLINTADFNQAIQLLEKAIKVCPNKSSILNYMGIAFHNLGKLNDAIRKYEEAINLNNLIPYPYNNIAIALAAKGKISEAKKNFLKATEIKPDFAEAHRHLSKLIKYDKRNSHLIQLEKLDRSASLSGDDSCHLKFALAKAYEDIGEIDLAFQAYCEGNYLRKKALKYHIDQDKKYFQDLMEIQPELVKQARTVKYGKSQITPIFIIGMPRSGTTLLEQIISSHHEVTGAGELSFIQRLKNHYFSDKNNITGSQIKNFREHYLKELANLSGGKKFIIDKMPLNFRYVPFIVAALPEARIIHITRNPRAVYWSNFKQYFSDKGLRFCYSWVDILDYYGMYKAMMLEWNKNYPKKISTCDYDRLTNKQEIETTKIISELNLKWDSNCLKPHQNTRIVKTASQQQVRQKVYKNSSTEWQVFEENLRMKFGNIG